MLFHNLEYNIVQSDHKKSKKLKSAEKLLAVQVLQKCRNVTNFERNVHPAIIFSSTT